MEIDFAKINLLIGEATNTVARKKREYVQPHRCFIYFNFLTPPGWVPTGEFEHWYNFVPSPVVTNLSDKHHLIHGHEKFVTCASPHYCHLLNYRPGPEYNPSFRLMFDKKWNHLYEQAK